MKTSTKYIINVFATGIFTFLLLSILLFWARWFPETVYLQNSAEEFVRTEIQPSGLVPHEIENDANVAIHSSISAQMYDLISCSSRMYLDINSEPECLDRFGVPRICGFSKIYDDRKRIKGGKLTYFDDTLGLFVSCNIIREMKDGQRNWVKGSCMYAGPKGISEKPDETLGRFAKVLVEGPGLLRGGRTIYDLELRQFFRIDFYRKIVVEGTQLEENAPKPLQIGHFLEKGIAIDVLWKPPQVESEKKSLEHRTRAGSTPPRRYEALRKDMGFSSSGDYLLVLDESGLIQKLDRKTLKFAGFAGSVGGLSTMQRTIQPKNLLAYDVKSFLIGDEYKGLSSASLSREGLVIALWSFDESGRHKAWEISKYRVLRAPGGVARIVAKYTLENIQPAVLSLISYFTASIFEATTGHSALFVLPNSVVATFGRYTSEGIVGRFFGVLVLIAPSIALSLLLAWRLRKDATVVGFTKRARLYWTIATILFGLSAYIAYRLTKPKETLVTCINCGKLRRPDMGKCHRCRSEWHVAELAVLLWRVVE